MLKFVLKLLLIILLATHISYADYISDEDLSMDTYKRIDERFKQDVEELYKKRSELYKELSSTPTRENYEEQVQKIKEFDKEFQKKLAELMIDKDKQTKELTTKIKKRNASKSKSDWALQIVRKHEQEMEEQYQKEVAEDKADTNDYRKQTFVQQDLFVPYFNQLTTQYDKDWALAATVTYCQSQLARIAIDGGANLDTSIEFVGSSNVSHSTSRWLFLNNENWSAQHGTKLNEAHSLPLHHPVTDRPCYCGIENNSYRKSTIRLLALDCGEEFYPFIFDEAHNINSLFIDALRHGDIKAVDFLISNGADVNYITPDKKTPLYYALSHPYTYATHNEKFTHKYLYQFILDRGAIIPNNKKIATTLLFQAAKYDVTSVTDMILETNFADVSALDKNGRNILFYVLDGKANELTSRKTLPLVFDKLIAAGADMNVIDNNGLSLLEYAKSKGYKRAIKFLVEYMQKDNKE